MGSGIAAHLANLGFKVSLLDVTAEAVEAGFDRAQQAHPPHFFTPQTADSIRLGTIENDPDFVSEADWVCEAITEDLALKRELFSRIAPKLSPDAMVTTNTSGLQISLLVEGMDEWFRKRFMGTHFFNPPRYLKLLELIPTDGTDPEAVKAMAQFLEEKAGRRVVVAKDTPGFIANRFGMWSMYNAIHVTERLHLPIEDVDLITGPFLGRPRSGSFRLNDLVGLDVMYSIGKNLLERCPNDPHISTLHPPQSLTTLMSRGWIGDKAGQGYYKKEGKELVALDLKTMAYRMKREAEFPSLRELTKLPLGERISKALGQRDEVGEFLRLHLVPGLRYAAYLKEEISHNVLDFDRVMMWGFGWEKGPFAMIDAIGAEKLGIDSKPYYEDNKTLAFSGKYVSLPKEPEYKPLSEYKVVSEEEGIRIRDLGQGVKALCLSTKMGTITPQVVRTLTRLLEGSKLEPFVFTSEAKLFSAGFDLSFFAENIASENFAAIDDALRELQDLGTLLAQKRCVAAVFGHCLGAGLELAFRCSAVAALAESRIGFPEAKVGLIPGGAGTVVMRIRNQDRGPKGLAEIAARLVSGVVSMSADDARALGILRATDVTVYHPDRLIHDAKQLALQAAPRPEEDLHSMPGPMAGMIDTMLSERRTRGDFTEYDEQIGLRIKTVFTKSTSYEDGLERERQMFLDLCSRSMTLLRIKHMLENGKPLRN